MNDPGFVRWLEIQSDRDDNIGFLSRWVRDGKLIRGAAVRWLQIAAREWRALRKEMRDPWANP